MRINGDGSIRIIYNGECPNSECTINSNGTSTRMGTSMFNALATDNKQVGYMYGYASIPTLNYNVAHKNEADSDIKSFLDTWYYNYIYNTSYELYISDTLFCNDRELQSNVGGEPTGEGFGAQTTFYAAIYRLDTNKNPALKCPLKNDRFTVSDTHYGNGALTYPIALLTADEMFVAGLNKSNTSNYLFNDRISWLLSPGGRYTTGAALRFTVYATTAHAPRSNCHTYWENDVRGVLNIKSDTEVTGSGTTSDPYIVI